MNEKIKKIFRAMTSAVLAGAFVFSSVIGGGADSFVSSSVAFAEETDSTSSVAERIAAAKEKYLSKLAEAKALSADNYSADSFALYQSKLKQYDRTTILSMHENSPYAPINYEQLCNGIAYAKSFLVEDPSHTYYNDLYELISAGEKINEDDYTSESYAEFLEQFNALKTGSFSLENAAILEENGKGINIYKNYIVKRYIPCFNLLVSNNRNEIVKEDTATGLKLYSNSDHISESDKLIVTKNDYLNWDWTECDSTGLTEIPSVCSNYAFYCFSLFNSSGELVDLTESFTVTIPISEEYDINNLKVEIYKNNAGAGAIATSDIDVNNRVLNITFNQSFLEYANGAAILIKNPITSVDPLTLT